MIYPKDFDYCKTTVGNNSKNPDADAVATVQLTPVFAWPPSDGPQMPPKYPQPNSTIAAMLPSMRPSTPTTPTVHHPAIALRRHRMQMRTNKLQRQAAATRVADPGIVGGAVLAVRAAAHGQQTPPAPLAKRLPRPQRRSLWHHYCLRSSVPGFRYLVDPTVGLAQR